LTKLVIISGSESIAKKLIAHQIQARLNSWTISEGHRIDLTTDPWTVYDPDGNNITTDLDSDWFDGNTKTDAEINANHAIYAKLVQLETNFRTTKFENHYYNKFSSVNYDLMNHVLTGVSDADKANTVLEWIPANEPSDATLHYPSEYDDIISKYNACTDDYQVITGAFGIEFINRIRASIGTGNVIAVNITRNPSVSFTLHQRITDFSDGQVDMSADDHMKKYYNSLYNSAILKQDSSITTIKFEDMISSESLTIDGTDVGVYLDFDAYNSWLTNFENNAIIDNVPTTAQQVLDWNTLAASFALVNMSDTNEDAPVDTIMGTPWNLFEKLGYAPLTLAEIRAS
jgi:hypothetical protein